MSDDLWAPGSRSSQRRRLGKPSTRFTSGVLIQLRNRQSRESKDGAALNVGFGGAIVSTVSLERPVVTARASRDLARLAVVSADMFLCFTDLISSFTKQIRGTLCHRARILKSDQKERDKRRTQVACCSGRQHASSERGDEHTDDDLHVRRCCFLFRFPCSMLHCLLLFEPPFLLNGISPDTAIHEQNGYAKLLDHKYNILMTNVDNDNSDTTYTNMREV